MCRCRRGFCCIAVAEHRPCKALLVLALLTAGWRMWSAVSGVDLTREVQTLWLQVKGRVAEDAWLDSYFLTPGESLLSVSYVVREADAHSHGGRVCVATTLAERGLEHWCNGLLFCRLVR